MTLRFIKLALISIFVLIVSGPAASVYAKELSPMFRGVRPLGMGNAFTAVANDENAIFYNPAGLNNIEGFGSFGLINPGIEISESVLDLVKEMQDIDTNNVNDITALFREYIGVHQHMRAYAMPHVTTHNFGLAVLGQGRVDAEFRNPVNPYADVNIAMDVVPVIGGAYGFYKGRLKLGLTAKMIMREGINKTYDATDVAAENFDPMDDMKDGSGTGFDLGAIYDFGPDYRLHPAIGLTVQNVGGVDLGDAGEELQRVNIGFGLIFDGPVDMLAAVDYVDITANAGDDKDLPKRLHIGIELKLPILLSIRTGINQGYPTYGATLNLKAVKIEYAAYSEELGAYAGQRADNRQILQVSLGWF